MQENGDSGSWSNQWRSPIQESKIPTMEDNTVEKKDSPTEDSMNRIKTEGVDDTKKAGDRGGGILDLTGALQIRDIEAELDLARGINPDLDSFRLRNLLLDTGRLGISPFSEWDDMSALKSRCVHLEQLVTKQREDLSTLRREYREMCKRTEQTQEEHFKLEALLRKTVAQEEQQLTILKRKAAAQLEIEREECRILAATLQEEQLRAQRLEMAMEACGNDMASAFSAMVAAGIEETQAADNQGITNSVKNDDAESAKRVNEDSVDVKKNRRSTSQRRKVPTNQRRIDVYDDVQTVLSRPPNPKKHSHSQHRHPDGFDSHYHGSSSQPATLNQDHSRPSVRSTTHNSDDICRSLAAVLPETLSALSETLGAQTAKQFLQTPNWHLRLLHILRTTDLSPEEAVLHLAAQPYAGSVVSSPDYLFGDRLSASPGKRDRSSRSYSRQAHYDRQSESRHRSRCRKSRSTGPVVRHQPAMSTPNDLWDHLKYLSDQLSYITKQHHEILETTSENGLLGKLRRVARYLEDLQASLIEKHAGEQPDFRNDKSRSNSSVPLLGTSYGEARHKNTSTAGLQHMGDNQHTNMIVPFLPHSPSEPPSFRHASYNNINNNLDLGQPLPTFSPPDTLDEIQRRRSENRQYRQTEIILPQPPSFAQPTFASSVSHVLSKAPSSLSSSFTSVYRPHHDHINETTDLRRHSASFSNSSRGPFLEVTKSFSSGGSAVPTTSQTTTASITSFSQAVPVNFESRVTQPQKNKKMKEKSTSRTPLDREVCSSQKETRRNNLAGQVKRSSSACRPEASIVSPLMADAYSGMRADKQNGTDLRLIKELQTPPQSSPIKPTEHKSYTMSSVATQGQTFSAGATEQYPTRHPNIPGNPIRNTFIPNSLYSTTSPIMNKSATSYASPVHYSPLRYSPGTAVLTQQHRSPTASPQPSIVQTNGSSYSNSRRLEGLPLPPVSWFPPTFSNQTNTHPNASRNTRPTDSPVIESSYGQIPRGSSACLLRQFPVLRRDTPTSGVPYSVTYQQ